jgi:AcrR family transcriptional regulator
MEDTTLPASQLRLQERAQRILDAAADLLLRWGYKRVTINDIARQTGIGTGTIYLHWKTRDALFEALMLRENIAIYRELLQRIRSDPQEVLLHQVMRSTLLIVMNRPLARALYTGDSELLGKLAQSSLAMQTRQVAPAKEFFALLRNLGLLRTDMDLSTQLYAFSATVTGFYLADPLLADEDQVPLERKAEALARTVQLAFEPETPPSPAALREQIVPEIAQYLERICDYCEQLMQERMVS